MASPTRSPLLLLIVAAVLAAPAAACRGKTLGMPAANDACGACRAVVHVLDDLLCDPSIDGTVVTWLEENVCAIVGADNKQQCADLVEGLTPALVEWVRASADPSALCADAGVCGGKQQSSKVATLLPLLKQVSQHKQKQQLKQPQQQRRSSSRPNDMTCPLCMYVAAKLTEAAASPATQASIHDASSAACAALPAGAMRDACTAFVEQYEMQFVKYIGTMEPAEVCTLIGTCLADALKRVAPFPPLSAAAARPLGQLAALAAASAPQQSSSSSPIAALTTTTQAPVRNDHCEACKAVVQEMHALVANPEVQQQAMDVAKQGCGLIPSLADTCRADVDQYAPMVFGMVLAYLQPASVCAQLKLCPAPGPPPAPSPSVAGIAAGVFVESRRGKFGSGGAAMRDPALPLAA